MPPLKATLAEFADETSSWVMHGVSEDHLKRIRAGVVVVACVWALASVASLFWAALPPSEVTDLPEVVNTPRALTAGEKIVAVDLNSMLGQGLFGTSEAPLPANAVTGGIASGTSGIEEGAEETRLDLVLVGTLAEQGSERGTAVIEAKGKQQTYTVGDRLPVGNSVTLAKVLSGRVVLDNNGTYELLTLFEDALSLGSSGQSTASRGVGAAAASAQISETRVDAGEGVDVAAQYRQKLYDNPRSLAELVQVSAVQDADGLRGYRITPGKNPRQFRALGFETGDIVVAVNGLPLSDVGNAARLYDMMREATEATFDVERDGAAISVAVKLDAGQER